MLFNYRQWQYHSDSEMAADPASENGLALCRRIVRRRFFSILFVIALTNALGILYAFTAQPLYTAKTTLMIETRKGGTIQQQSGFGEMIVDNGMMDTQVEILRSEKMSRSVIKRFHLTKDREFIRPHTGFAGNIARLAGYLFGNDELVDALVADFFDIHAPTTDFDLERVSLISFARYANIRRLGQSYMIEISFTSSDAAKAARIANAIVDAYMSDQLDARIKATRRTTEWLQDRVQELSRQASARGNDVIEFKERHNIVGANGRLMIEQQLAEISTQRTLARSATVAAKARYDRILAIMQQEIPDETVADALGNSVIVRLRGQYLDIKTRKSSFSAKYGEDHRAVIDLENQKRLLRISIADELRRISEAYKSEYDIARMQEETINAKVESLIAELQSSNRAQLRLHELEIGAQAYRALYDNFLQRYTESIQQQSFPIMEARVMAAATQPWQRSYPKVLNILGATFGTSLILGFGIGMLREL